jgi:hypothetical protein
MNHTTIVLLLAVLVAATLVIATLAAAASAITKSLHVLIYQRLS